MDKNEQLAKKYVFLRDKIIKNYKKGCKILNIVKILFAVVFIIFTVIAVILSDISGEKMQWLVWWIVFILFDVTVFLITDYCKYLVKDKVIPYLEDDDLLEFGEYSIFLDDDELEEEEDED